MATYYYGHGEAWIATRDSNGNPEAMTNLPEISGLSISLAEERIEHISKENAIASKDLSVPRMISASGKLTIDESSADVLKLVLFGTKSTVTGGAFSNVAFPSGIVAGEWHQIGGGRTHISTLTSIQDSAGSPATLVLDTNYEVDLDAGMVKFIDVTGFTQPFKANGTEAAGTGVGVFTDPVLTRYLRFKGINVANDNAIVVVELYKCSLSPTNEWTLLNDGNEVNKYEIDFELLKDSTKASDATFGQYGKYRE